MDKKKRIQQITKHVDEITDRLGMPVDEGIKQTVIYLQALGFPTNGSCEGHPNKKHGLDFPWVDVGEEHPTHKNWFKNEKLMAKIHSNLGRLYYNLIILLNKYYKHRKVDYDVMLDASLFATWIRLQSKGGEAFKQFSKKDKSGKIFAYTKEMKDFTKFLEKEYWKK